jgi:hypothetical protein
LGALFTKAICTRGLQCFKLNGNHTEKDRYWQKNDFLLFAKMFENVQFFSHLHFKYAKSAIMTPKKSYSQKTRRILSIFVFGHFCGFLLLTLLGNPASTNLKSA